MASTFSTNLAIELIGTGDQAGTWGTTTNSNLGTLIEQAISGYVTQAVATGTDTTITIPNGSTGVARNMYIELTGTGGTNTNLIVPANKKLYFIFNNSTGAVTVKVSGQTGVSVPTGKKMVLVSNGTDIVNGLNYIADFGTNSFSVTNLTASSATITNLIATSGSITNLVSSDASATVLRAGSATLTHLSATSASITNLALTSLTISSLSITNVSVASATVSSNLTLSGGTANGVLYLNGSKVATSGSALTFDGTYFTANGLRLAGTDVTNTIYQATGQLGITTGTAAGITFATNLTTRMSLDGSGNLGIGTSSPATKLDVNGDVTQRNGSGTIIGNIQNSSGWYDFKASANVNGAQISTAAATPIRFLPNGVEAARFDSSGNLGLGVTPPAWESGTQSINVGAGTALWNPGSGTVTRLITNAFRPTAGNYTYRNNGGSTYYEQSGSTHAWYNAATGTAGNAISFTTALTLNANGNLVLQGGSTSANGIGVTFPATQSASSNANCLDDYEEGNWTPEAVCTGQTITYTDRFGRYTKIGRQVFAQCAIIINTVSGAAGGNTTISGLPFTNGDGTYTGQGFANTIYATWISGTSALFRAGTRGSGNDAGGFSAGGYIFIEFVYLV